MSGLPLLDGLLVLEDLLLLLQDLLLLRKLLPARGFLLLLSRGFLLFLLRGFLLFLLCKLLLSRRLWLLLLLLFLLLGLLLGLLLFLAPTVCPRCSFLGHYPTGACTGPAADCGAYQRPGWPANGSTHRRTRQCTAQSTGPGAGPLSGCSLRFLSCVRGTTRKPCRSDRNSQNKHAC